MRAFRLLKNEYVYSVVTKVFSLVTALLQSVLLARYLGAALRGQYSYIGSVMSVASIIIAFGMQQAYPYFRKQKGRQAIYQDFISLVYLVYAVYLTAAALLALLLVKDPELRTALLITPLYGYEHVLSYVYLVEHPNRGNTAQALTGFADLLFVAVLMLFTKRGFYSIALILAFSELLKAVVYTVLAGVRPAYHRGQLALLRQLLRMGFFPMLALLMTTLNYKLDILMLKRFDFITAAQLGVYSVGVSVADKIALIPDSLKSVLVSRLAKGAGNQEVAKVCRLCLGASGLVSLLFVIFGKPALRLLFGAEYDGAYSVLVICALGALFIGYFKLIAQYNIVHKKQNLNVLILSVSIAVNVALNLLLIPRWGLNGAAFASGAGYFLSGCLFILWFVHTNRVKLSDMLIVQKTDLAFLRKSADE